MRRERSEQARSEFDASQAVCGFNFCTDAEACTYLGLVEGQALGGGDRADTGGGSSECNTSEHDAIARRLGRGEEGLTNSDRFSSCKTARGKKRKKMLSVCLYRI